MILTISQLLERALELVSPPSPQTIPLLVATSDIVIVVVATTLHLYSPEKLFNRAIATGGSFLLVGPFSPEIYEGIYQRVLSVLGLDTLEPEERIRKLLTLPLDEVIAKLPPDVPFMPVIDGDIIPLRPSYGAVGSREDLSLPGKEWLDGFMIGDSQFDVRKPFSRTTFQR